MHEQVDGNIELIDRRRSDQAYHIRHQAALKERERPAVLHRTNGDEETYSRKIASFTKCLPHDDLGEVDLDAYRALLRTFESHNIKYTKDLHLNGTLRLTGPMGGFAFSIEGPDAQAIEVPPPHPFSSPELAGEMAELYWMALLRDVPFT